MGFIDTWKEIITKPSEFFENMPTSGGYADPLKFVLICYIPVAVIMGFIYGGMLSLILGPIGVLGLILTPLLMMVTGIIGVFIVSIIVHIGVLIFAGQNKSGFEATLRLVSYAQAVTVASWIPFLGIIFSLYGIYLGIVGVLKVHKTTGIRAVLAYAGFLLVLGTIFAFAMIFAIYSGMSQGMDYQYSDEYSDSYDSSKSMEEINKQIERELEQMEKDGSASLGTVPLKGKSLNLLFGT